MTKVKKSWKEYIQNIASYNLSSKASSSVADWADIAFKIRAVEENETIYNSNFYGTVENEEIKDFSKLIEELKHTFHLIESSTNNTTSNQKDSLLQKIVKGYDLETGKSNFIKIFVSDNTVIEIYSSSKNEFKILMKSFDEEQIVSFAKKFNSILKKKKDRQGRVCTLLMDRSSLYVSDLGPAGVPLIRENYTKEVLKGYDFLVKDLGAEMPRGRLAILDGEPGTGKSFILKSLINDISNVIFLIVPSTLVSRISDPSFMPAIINLHEEEKVPIIMLLEDADATLLPRGTDNMGSISDLLNFADGIVGKIIDFRIVATTNAKKIEIEPALMRKGRLSKHIHVGKLENTHAFSIFERITKHKLTHSSSPELLSCFNNKLTLAEVYDLAYDFLENVANEKKN